MVEGWTHNWEVVSLTPGPGHSNFM